MADVQCQACTQFSKLPDSMGAYEGPWTCPNCNARHRIKTSFHLLLTNSLEDRFTIDQPKCSIEREVVSDIKEAVAAFNAFVPRAAVVMVRRALQRACINKGAKGSTLCDQIKDLHNRLKIFDDAHVALATATRLFGNFGAHPNDDLLEDLSEEEARRALDLGIYLINKMY